MSEQMSMFGRKELNLPDTSDMLKFQDEMAERFSYKKMPPDYSEECRAIYRETLPDWVQIDGDDKPLVTKEGTKIANGYDRVVIGDYGAFIEISKEDMELDSIHTKPSQRYRESGDWKNRVKYFWKTADDNSDIKIYEQQRGVTYADYQPGKYYVSPFEVEEGQEREKTKPRPVERD